MPEAWRFVFLDQATSGNCRVVTVAAKTSSEHPDTVEAFSSAKIESVSANQAIAQNKWLLDSDQALAQAREAAKLKGFTAAEYQLSQLRSGQEPVWTLTFFSEDGKSVAHLQVGARTGTVKMLAEE